MPANLINNQYPSIQQMTEALKAQAESKSASPARTGLSFEEVLRNRTAEGAQLKVSKHATSRFTERNIDLSTEQWERLESGVEKAEAKGIRESLVMVDDFAFIVNVNSKTVITAVGESDEKVFTNIDGAVVV